MTDRINGLKRKFADKSLNNLSFCDTVELLLSYSQKNGAGDKARLLNEKYGCLSEMLNADYLELKELGVGDTSALFIKLLTEVFKYCAREESFLTVKCAAVTGVDAIGKYLVSKFIGIAKETVMIIPVDKNLKMIDCMKLYEGALNSIQINARIIAEQVIRVGASDFILAHNHPAGLSEPSENDIACTKNLIRIFEMFDIRLTEHIIVAGNSYTAIIGNNGKT